jgi:hypothetical protein
MSGKKELGEFLDGLDKEDAQERAVEAHEGSYFESAPDDTTILVRAREFDDVHKHWARRELWLRTAKRIRKAKGAGLRLLTLPGQHQFEVKLYAKEELLALSNQDGGDRLEVVGFENDPAIFGLLATAEPKLLELLRGDILAALIEPVSANGKALRAHAPYDLINLDLTSNIATSNDGPYSPFLKGVRECFQLQGNQTGSWALMVTFRAGMMDTEPTVVTELAKLFQQNIDDHLLVKEACLERYGVDTAEGVLAKDPEGGLGQFTGKWVIEQAHAFEWECTFYRHAAYDREYEKDGKAGRYSLRKLVFEFSRHLTGSKQMVLSGIPPQSWHAQDLSRLFEQAALLDVDDAVSKIKARHRERLEKEIEEMR